MLELPELQIQADDEEDERDRIAREFLASVDLSQLGAPLRELATSPGLISAADAGVAPPAPAPQQSAAPAPAATPPPAATATQAPPAQRPAMQAATNDHDALEEMRRDAETRYLTAATTPQSESAGSKFGTWIGDNAVGLFGTFLDAALNKGRNIPTILTQNAAAQAQSEAARRARDSQADDFALRASGQRLAARRAEDAADRDIAYKRALAEHWRAQNALGQGNLAARTAAGDLAQRKFEAERDPQDATAIAFRQFLRARGITDANLDNMGVAGMRMAQPALSHEFDSFYAPQKRQEAAAQAGAVADAATGARIRTELEYAPATTAADAARAGAVASAQSEAQRASGEAAGAAKLMPGFSTVDDAAYAQNASDPTTFRKMQDVGSGSLTALDALRRMRKLRQQYGTQLVGNAKTQYDMAQAAVNTGLTQLGSTGTLTDSERSYYMSMVPSMSPSAVDIAKVGGKDIKLEQLDGAIRAFENMINSKMHIYGVSVDDGGANETPTPGAPPAPTPPRPRPRPKAPGPPAGKYKGFIATRNPDGTYTVQQGTRTKVAPAAWVENEFTAGGGVIQ